MIKTSTSTCNWFCIIQNHWTSIEEIDKIKLNKKLRLNFSYSSNSNIKDILNNFSKTMLMAQDFFENKKIDCAIIMGDRYEMLAVALVCLNNNIPIAHVCGGSETYGSIDNEYRNSISQMSKFHFVEINIINVN